MNVPGNVSRSVGAERDVATPTLDRVHDQLAEAGVVSPSLRSEALAVGPDGYELNVTVTTDEHAWRVGPAPPSPRRSPNRASRRVSVRVGPGQVRPGTLRVVVWS